MPAPTPIINGEKRCGKCGKVKPLSDFGKEKRAHRGLSYACRVCMRKHYYDYRRMNLAKERNREAQRRKMKRVEIRLYFKKRRKKQRQLVFAQYGNNCACCKESRTEFLAIDHINGGGNKQRKEIGRGNLLDWIIRNEFPKGYQILCHNCNFAKGVYGYCPHQKKEYPTRFVRLF